MTISTFSPQIIYFSHLLRLSLGVLLLYYLILQNFLVLGTETILLTSAISTDSMLQMELVSFWNV